MVAALSAVICRAGPPSVALHDPNAFVRQAIFLDNIRKIEATQAQQPEATFGINEFTDLSDEEFAATYLTTVDLGAVLPSTGDGANDSRIAQRDRRAPPEKYFSPDVSPIARWQQGCGSCWAFATCGLVEAAWKKTHGVYVTLAPQQLLDCTAGTCKDGWYPSSALDYAVQLSRGMGGLMAERDYSYAAADRQTCGYEGYKAAASIDRYLVVGADENVAMPQALVDYSAILVTLNAGALKSYHGGVILDKECTGAADHAVLITGYDRNTFFRIRKGVNACNIAKASGGGYVALATTCTAKSGGACAYGKEVGNDGQWGDWGGLDSCPGGRFTVGFVTKSEAGQGKGDDTALNGVRLICDGGDAQSGPTSLVGPWGTWDEPVFCPTGYYVGGLQVLVEKGCGKCDDTALNAIKVLCRDRRGSEVLWDVSHSKTSWGEWSKWYSCPEGTAVTGIRTRLEPKQGKGDDTALNAVRLRCTPF
eukprot:m51a1_g6156 hypothetical protein (478) ;mRNA; r:316673-318476